MAIFKVLLDFVIFSVSDKLIFYRNVILKLTANPTYLTPDPTLIQLKAAVDSLEQAMLAAQDGGHTAVSAMHDHDKSTTLMFRNLAHFVDKLAIGDETKILTSGFHPSNQALAHEKVELTVNDGNNSGAVNLGGKAHPKGGAYIWQKSTKENPLLEADWATITMTTQAHCYVESLTPATYVYFRYCVVTPTGITDYCAPVRKLIV